MRMGSGGGWMCGGYGWMRVDGSVRYWCRQMDVGDRSEPANGCVSDGWALADE